MSEIRILADNLGKRYVRRAADTPTSWRTLLAAPWRRARSEPFWALREVSFSVAAGEMLGVIGPNGAGKSTLLCLLSGISLPTAGRVAVHGRIGALLELGGGFVDDLTGRENAILAGVTAGLTRAEMVETLDDIVQFAEISEFLDAPVRTYSTGMRMRLAFAVAVHTRPDVLLVDEFLAVGDLSFQAKCRSRIAELRAYGCATVVVSHGMGDVRDTCDRVLWLRDGLVAALDTPDIVTELYQAEMHERTLRRTPARQRRRANSRTGDTGGGSRLGSREMEITAVALRPGPLLHSGDPFTVELGYRTHTTVRPPIFGVSITREDGTLCVDTNTEGARLSTEGLPAVGSVQFSIRRLELAAGRYFANVGIFEHQWSHAYDYHWHLYPFTVDSTPAHKGMFAPPCQWEFGAGAERSPAGEPLLAASLDVRPVSP